MGVAVAFTRAFRWLLVEVFVGRERMGHPGPSGEGAVYAARRSDWVFEDGPTTMAFLSQTVHTGEEAVTYVCHDADDGAW